MFTGLLTTQILHYMVDNDTHDACKQRGSNEAYVALYASHCIGMLRKRISPL